MSHENVEIVRRVSDAYNRRDVGAMLVELHPEIEWYPWLQIQLGGGATVYRQSKRRSGTLASESSPSVGSGDAAMRAAQ